MGVKANKDNEVEKISPFKRIQTTSWCTLPSDTKSSAQLNKDLEILFENETLVAINKPHGLLVHRSKIARDAKEFALQMLRDQLGMTVYPCHRLDRKTSGILLFAKDPKTNTDVQKLFQERKVQKRYSAIVRGYTAGSDTINYPLTHEGKTKTAETSYKLNQHFEINLPANGHPTSRYSLIEVSPTTGRFHQIRKHMAHVFHPILGDRPHGCNKQNKLWKEQYNMTKMMLHASHLSLESKTSGRVIIEASYSDEFQRVLTILTDQNRVSQSS